MSECNCNCTSSLPTIKQGDDCFLQCILYFNGERITANELPLLDEIEYCFVNEDPNTVKAADAWNEGLACFLLLITQEQSFALEEGRTALDVRVRFRGGNVLGSRQMAKMRVLDAASEEVLPHD